MATMLSASAASEERDMGSHDVALGTEPEHIFTSLGAVSLQKTTIRGQGGRHVQHDGSRDVRGTSSLDYDLTNGRLGNMFAEGDQTGLFEGYDMPVILDPQSLSVHDTIYVPKALASRNEGYGVFWNEQGVAAVERKLAMALQNVYNRNGKQQTSSLIRTMLESA